MTSNRKKRAILISAVLVTAIFFVGMSLAYFTDRVKVRNQIQIGKISGTVEEISSDSSTVNDDGGFDYTDYSPGDKLDKEPYLVLSNDADEVPAYARAKVTVTSDTLSDAEKNEILTGLDIQSNWVRGEDGYYYYQKVMKPGDQSDKIFTTVTIPADWASTKDKPFNIEVSGQFIQSENLENNVLQKNADGQITGWQNIDAADADNNG